MDMKLPDPADSGTYPPELPKLLTIQEFYDALDRAIGINFLREAVRAGRIKSVSVGRKRLIPRAEVDAWLMREAGVN